MSDSTWDLIIVGGGAAGLWGAGTAAAAGLRVLVLEKNRKAGVKILMSGGTRCNITHNCDWRGIAEAFGSQGKFLKSSLSRLTPQDVVQVFEELGVSTKIEDTGKIFPASDRAIDVRDALVRRLEAAGATLRTGIGVTDVRLGPGGVFEVTTPEAAIESRTLMLTTGGLSYSGCGTTGDGYPWAAKFGHTVEPTRPALAPILSHASWVHDLQGITLPDVGVVAAMGETVPKKQADPRRFSRSSLLWTHFGLSGPAAMNVSRAFESDGAANSDSKLLIDLMPDWNEDACRQWLTPGSDNHKRNVISVMGDQLPKKVVSTIVEQTGIDGSRPLAELSKTARHGLVQRLKGWVVPIHGTRGYPKAEVTAGGVSLSEVDSKTLASRVQPGLYFSGEILDVDGPIGGFNFQAAFSTSHAAATAIASQLKVL